MASIQRGELDFYTAVKQLLPHQRQFIGAAQRNVAYVGGQGSGKSVGLCIAAILHGASEPNGFSLIGRLNMPALINSTMKTYLELAQDSWGEWKPTEKRFKWNNGHETVFWHLDTSDPRVSGHIKSMNLSGAFIDEAVEVSEELYFLIDGRVRRKGCQRRVVRLASNPAGHDYVWRHFFDPNRRPELRTLNLGINASSFANTHLDQAALDHWRATYPPDWAERYINGSFSDFSDLIYKEFTDSSHTWDSSLEWPVFGGRSTPPLDWPIIIGMDIGSDVEHDPWAIPLIAVAPDARLYQFDEVYGNGLLIADIAERIHTKLHGRPTPLIAYDYAQRQCALELSEHHVFGQPAIKEVRPGLFKVAQYMHMDQRLKHPFTGVDGSPRFFIASHCRHTIDDILGYKYAKDRSGRSTEDPAHEHSHGPDGIRYAIHTFRPLPEKPQEMKVWQNPALDEMSRMYWRDAEKFARESHGEAHQPKYQRATGLRFQRPSQPRFDPKKYRTINGNNPAAR